MHSRKFRHSGWHLSCVDILGKLSYQAGPTLSLLYEMGSKYRPRETSFSAFLDGLFYICNDQGCKLFLEGLASTLSQDEWFVLDVMLRILKTCYVAQEPPPFFEIAGLEIMSI